MLLQQGIGGLVEKVAVEVPLPVVKGDRQGVDARFYQDLEEMGSDGQLEVRTDTPSRQVV
jgi:hypothetical protein